jgi:peptidyl-tRNA hydrolase
MGLKNPITQFCHSRHNVAAQCIAHICGDDPGVTKPTACTEVQHIQLQPVYNT